MVSDDEFNEFVFCASVYGS